MSEEKREVRKATLGEALLSFGLLAVIMAIAIIKYGVDPHVPMFCGVIVATLISLKIGYTYSELEFFSTQLLYNRLNEDKENGII